MLMDESQTAGYFDRFTPHFNPSRFGFALDFLRENAAPDHRLIDIGCGDGATLAMIKENTPLQDITGMDISASYLESAQHATGCGTVHGSILDRELVGRYAGQFEFAVLGAVLHHLVGKSRTESISAAAEAVSNAAALLVPGGHLIIFEPMFRPRSLMWGVYWTKNTLSRVFSGRLELGPSWLNIAEPIVSYYDRKRIHRFIADAPLTEVSADYDPPQRLGGLIERTAASLVLRRE